MHVYPVIYLCSTLWDPVDCSPPGSFVHEIFQARILERVAISFSRASSQPRERTCISCISRSILYHWATWEAIITTLQTTPKLSNLKQQTPTHSFCRSEIWVQLSWVPLALGLSWSCIPAARCDYGCIWRLIWGEESDFKFAHVVASRFTFSWVTGVRSSVPCPVGLSVGQLTTRQLISHRASEREKASRLD